MCIPAWSHTPNCDLEKHVSQSLLRESGQAESIIPARRTPTLQISVVGECSSQPRTMPRGEPFRNFPEPGCIASIQSEHCPHPLWATSTCCR